MRLSHRVIQFGVASILFSLSFSAESQQPKKVPRIGYLSAQDPARASAGSEAIRLALRELGYIEGQNITIEYRYAEGKSNRDPQLAAELVRLKVDVIIAAGGDRLVLAIKNRTKTIPIVMVGTGSDPVETGLVESLARPGSNVTGLTTLNRELGGKRLELLKEAVPKVARVGVFYDPATPAALEVREFLPAAARELGLTLRSWEVRDADGLDRVFVALTHLCLQRMSKSIITARLFKQKLREQRAVEEQLSLKLRGFIEANIPELAGKVSITFRHK